MLRPLLAKFINWIFTVKAKLALLISVLIGLIALFIYLYFPANLQKFVLHQFQAKAHSISAMSAFNLSSALYFDDLETINETFASAKQNRDLVYIIVVDDSGKVIASHNLKGAPKARNHVTENQNLQSLESAVYSTKTPILINNQQIGTLYMGISLEQIIAHVEESKRTIFFVSLAVFLIGILAVFGISNYITIPMIRMVKTVQLISDGDLSQRAQVTTRDEVGCLADNFNKMVENLENTQGELKEANDRSENRAEQLQEEMKERQKAEQEREAMHKELNEVARRAGMADVATSVLHNVGNVLNTVNTSISVIGETLERSKITGFFKATDLLKENIGDIEGFILRNPKGKKLLEYYLKLEESLQNEQVILNKNIEKLEGKVSLINDVITAQQTYSNEGLYSEKLALSEVIDNAMKIQKNSMLQHKINLHKFYKTTPEIKVQKIKLVHILMNLYKNSKEAMFETDPIKRLFRIEVDNDVQYAWIRISDSGPGISEENLGKIFSYGFTTKENGHGFGLHSCANYMTEMGGKMWAEPNRDGAGATFVLQFPM
ncbi:MAG: HAMP domain-containing protein [Calditrichaeota bacterium]|nr:MAG: HAMP domain-containing protein [Calditrichota bacterium]